ncbi:Uncharacterised protein [Mycobacteroides abscessus subsp. abscessus]|nr:Uncharacterised protein [Mycobacteroides abscessus subsp. abscessus]
MSPLIGLWKLRNCTPTFRASSGTAYNTPEIALAEFFARCAKT